MIPPRQSFGPDPEDGPHAAALQARRADDEEARIRIFERRIRELTLIDDALAGHGLDAAAPPPAEPGETATLRVPLRRLIDAHGLQTTLDEAVVEVRIDHDGVLDRLAGLPIDSCPVRVVSVRQELTGPGRAVIEALALLLSQDGGEGR